MTFVCVADTKTRCRYVWCAGGRGHFYSALPDHQRWAIQKIWQWVFGCWGQGRYREGGPSCVPEIGRCELARLGAEPDRRL